MIERMPERLAINLETLLDQGPWNMRRKSVMLMVALAVVFDGFDTALLGLAVPMISAELQIDLGAFAFIFAMGLAGMSIGTVAGGILGDRIGRRRMVIASVLMFSIPTIAIAWSTGIETFALLRLLAGFGLGSLLPNGGALVAEFTPARWRSMAVMLTMMCIAVGSVIAGILSSGLLDLMGWRGLFVIGGMVPVGYALLLLYALPESPVSWFVAPETHHNSHRRCHGWGSSPIPMSSLSSLRIWSKRHQFEPSCNRPICGIA